MKQVLVFCLLVASSFYVLGQQQPNTDEGMKTYYLVFLKKGPNRSQDSIALERLQENHLAHLTKMASTGKMDLAGPLLEDGDIRGICVYNTTTMEEAWNLASADPAVVAGRLIVEIHPWYSMKGACLK